MLAVALISVAEGARLLVGHLNARRARGHAAIHLGWVAVYIWAVAYQLLHQTTLHPDYLGHLFNACTLLPLGCVMDAGVARSTSGATGGRWWQLAFPPLTVAALALAATAGRPPGLDAFPLTVGATLLYYAGTFTPVASGTRAFLWLPLVNATLLVYPDLYTVDTCHARRHLYTVMIEASTIGRRFVDHPDDLFVWADGRAPNGQLTQGCYAGIALTDVATSLRSIGHGRLGQFTDENPFANEEDHEGYVAFVTATEDGYKQFESRMATHDVRLRTEARYLDLESGLRVYFLWFTSGQTPQRRGAGPD
jgi:hypothetical protein